MKESEIKKLRDEIQYVIDRESNNYEGFVTTFTSLLRKIHALEYKDRKRFKDLYELINSTAFHNGINLDEYQPELYFQGEKKSSRDRKKSKEQNLEEKTLLLRQCVEEKLEFFPRHIFLRLTSGKEKYSFILLYNQETLPNFLKRIKASLTEKKQSCEILSVVDFHEKLKSDSDYRNSNFLVFFTFTVRIEPKDYLDEYFDPLGGYFEVEQLKYTKIYDEISIEKQLEKIREELEFLMMIEFVNLDLTHYELKAIKLLFGKNKINQIHYRLNTKGFSGSKVLSIVPYSHIEKPRRFIVKISDRDSDKLRSEHSKFSEYVELHDTDYRINVTETERCLAIRYDYATSKSDVDSSSFGEIINKRTDIGVEKKLEHIKEVFSTELYNAWNNKIEDSNINFSHYKDYINIEKIKEQLRIIFAKENVGEIDIIKIFNKISKMEIEGKTQICHGDLHTENFFIDDKDVVFLIDFGDVGIHHNMIDFAMLETSIKLNHMPKYIPLESLIDIEKKLATDQTFEKSYTLNGVERDDLKDVYNLIIGIRKLARNKFSNTLEYYFSLFMMTFRQIRYQNLNQLFAIEVAKIYGNKLISEYKK